MRTQILIAAAWFGVLAAGSAPAQRGLRAPHVTVQSLEPLPSNAGETRFRVLLLIDNPNTQPLPIRSFEFKLRLADQGIVDGNSTGPLTVGALEQQPVTLDLASEIVSSVSRLLSFAQGPGNAIPYEIYGTVTLDRRRLDPLRFGSSGQVPLLITGER